ncbi:ABC transporter permease [Clostridium sp. chh4-2]|uniref:ABC transporter permease n=1 Tax=Clostridium sp. chh4-2 TaxID=2067550 RepID=UPI000CCE23EB|nr:ABC transporter permease subunit [Clostridium sp. chh4-2]PNV60570.1 ABC transporter permease [Clostridium sp. chh4-2]
MEMIVKEKIKHLFPSEGNDSGRIQAGCGLAALYRKEMADHIRSRRFLIVLALILLTSFASIYGALSSLQSAISTDSDFIFLKLFTLSGNSIPSFTAFIALLGPFVGLTLGFDAINSERSEGTLNRLVAQPIYRDAVINGKFLAGATIILIMVFAMGLTISAIGLLATGIPPEGEEVGRLFVFLLFTAVYICFWLALSILFSVICRHAATSALAVIAIWIFFALFMSLVVNIVANSLYPINQMATAKQILGNYSCQLNLNRLSPYYLYSEAVSTIMNPSIRSMNVITPQQLSGAITGYLSLGQSLLLVWPHMTGLLAITAVIFAGSYISFMRKEIRSR